MGTQKEPPSEERSWSSLPTDILHLISSRLSWSNHPSFKLVCKHWSSVISPFYPVWITPLLLNTAEAGSDLIRYYSPYFNKNFELNRTLRTPEAKLCCTTGGFLTLGRSNEIIIADLISCSLIEIPRSYSSRYDFNIRDGNEIFCATIMDGAVDIGIFDGEHWSFYSHERKQSFWPSDVANPVLHDGLFYFLGEEGNLGVYDPSKDTWTILPKPQSFGFSCDDCYLIKSEGKLMSVLIGHRGTPIHILRLDEQLMEWEKVEKLEGRAVFTGTLTSIMKTTFKSMENKIYLSRFYDELETIQVELKSSNGQLAFVPRSPPSKMKQLMKCGEPSIWSHELGQEEPQDSWDTVKLSYSIWVDFNCKEHKSSDTQESV